MPEMIMNKPAIMEKGKICIVGPSAKIAKEFD
jgi:hypothetical protein